MKKEIKNATILEKTVRRENGKILKRVQHDMEVYGHCERMRSNPANYFARSADKVISLFTSHLSPKDPLTSHFSRKFGFTLAEVLITLGIIGVVAAMTMPSLINKYKISQYETGIKRTYSVVTNGFRNMIAGEGSELDNLGIFSDNVDVFNEELDKALRKYFKVVKICKIGDTASCPGYDVKYLKSNTGTSISRFKADSYLIVYLSDGTMFSVENKKCEPTTEKPDVKICAWILADINGEKAPNTYGKDVFGLSSLTNQGTLFPDASREYFEAYNSYYWRNNSNQCGEPDKKVSKSSESEISGQNCLARIMENSWKIDYLD